MEPKGTAKRASQLTTRNARSGSSKIPSSTANSEDRKKTTTKASSKLPLSINLDATNARPAPSESLKTKDMTKPNSSTVRTRRPVKLASTQPLPSAKENSLQSTFATIRPQPRTSKTHVKASSSSIPLSPTQHDFDSILAELADSTTLNINLPSKVRKFFGRWLQGTTGSNWERSTSKSSTSSKARTQTDLEATERSHLESDETNDVDATDVEFFRPCAIRTLTQCTKLVPMISSYQPLLSEQGTTVATAGQENESGKFKYAKKSLTKEVSPPVSKPLAQADMLRCVTIIADICLEALQSLEIYQLTVSFDTEKTASNMITKLLEAGDSDSGLQLLIRIYPKVAGSSQNKFEDMIPSLSKKIAPDYLPSKKPITTKSVKSSLSSMNLKTSRKQHSSSAKHKNQTQAVLAPPLQMPSFVADKKACTALLAIPHHKDQTDDTVSSSLLGKPKPPLALVLTIMYNTLRCLITVDNLDLFTSELESLLLQDNGIHSWCKLMWSSDKVNGARFFDHIFRYLHRLASATSNYLHGFTLRKLAVVFFINSTSFSIDTANDIVLRAAHLYEKDSRQANAFDVELLQSFYTWAVENVGTLSMGTNNMKLMLWAEQCIHFAKKNDIHQLLTMILSFVSDYIVSFVPTESDCNIAIFRCYVALEKFISRNSESSSSESKVTDFTHSLALLKVSMEAGTKPSQEFDKVAEMSTQKVILPTTEVLVALAFYQDSIAGDSIYAYLERASDMSMQWKNLDAMKVTSVAWYNLGSSMYKKGEHRQSELCFTKSCDSLKFIIECAKDGSMDTEADGYKQTLSRRLEALGSSQMAQGIVEVINRSQIALESFQGAIVALPMKVFATKSFIAADATRKLLERTIKLSQSRDQYRSLVQLFVHVNKVVAPEEMSALLDIAEFELDALYSLSKCSVSSAVETLVDDVLKLEYTQEFPVRRARFLIEKARQLRAKGTDSLEEIEKSLKEVIELLKREDLGLDSHLQKQVSNDLAIANSLYGICLNERNKYRAKPLKLAIQIWRKVLSSVRPYPLKMTQNEILAAREHFNDVEKAYRSLTQRITALRLLLKMNNIRESSVDGLKSDAVQIYASIGCTYITLGYTGNAGVALANGRALLDFETALDVNEGTITFWRLCYSYYLCSVGNADKGASVFSQIPPLSSDKKKSSKYSLCSLKAFAFFVKGNISLAQGNLAHAIHESDSCIRLLSRMLRNGTGEDGDSEKYNAISTVGQWQAVQRFLEYYGWMGQLYLLRGSFVEAEYYYKQGLELAQQSHSNIHISEFLLRLAAVDYKRERLEESRQHIAEADESMEPVSDEVAAKEVVGTLVCQADCLAKHGSYADALDMYSHAEEALDDAMKESTIRNIEEKGMLLPETPRDRKIAYLPAQNSPTLSPKDKSDGSQTECFILGYLKADLSSKASAALSMLGKMDDAEKKLKEGEDLPQRGLEQAEYYSTLAKLKLQKVLKGLTGNPLLEMFSDSAFSLPWCVPSLSRPNAKTQKARKGPPAIQKNLSQLGDLLHEAFQNAKLFGTPHMMYELCHNLALLNMMKGYLGGGTSETAAKELAVATAFYLDQCQGVTLRRELLGILHEKVTTTGLKVQWPRTDSADATEESQGCEKQKLLHKLYNQEVNWTPEDFSREIIEKLPSEWTVVSLTADTTTDDLYITRLKRDQIPVVVRLPMKRLATREGEDDGLGVSGALEELKDILKRSDVTTAKASTLIAAGEQPKEEKMEWWKERKDLDERLMVFLERLEIAWLGGFKGLLLDDDFANPELEGCFGEFKNALETILVKAVAGKTRMKPLPLEAELCRMILRLGPEPESGDVEDVLYYLMDAYQYAGCPIGYDEINIDSMESDLSDAITRFHRRRSELLRPKDRLNSEHVILILGKQLQALPWESIPCLRGHSVSRLPSLSFLRDRLISLAELDGQPSGVSLEKVTPRLEVNADNTFYLLNPSQDLANTQKEFEGLVTSETAWAGVIGRAPSEQEFEEGLQNSDLTLYFGHGGGEQYIRGHRIRKLDKCAVTLLMGCSSGRLNPAGEFDPSGTALNYLAAGCPALVANLWDVTDRDIDRFSKTLFDMCGITSSRSNGGSSVTEGVARARNNCKLKYRYLEDPDGVETKKFVDDQNALFQDFIKEKADIRNKYSARLTELFNYERYGCPTKNGDAYYYFHNSGLQAQSVLYKMDTLDSKPKSFLDPNTLSSDGTVSLNTYSFSESGKYFAYALSQSGSDWVKIHVKETRDDAVGDFEDKPVEWAKFTSISWTHDDKGYFYVRYKKPEKVADDKAGTETDESKNQILAYHRIGTPQSEDIICLQAIENPEHMYGVSVTADGRYVVLKTSESCDPKNLVSVCDLQEQFGGNSIKGVPVFKSIVKDWLAEFDVIANIGTVFYFQTTLDAPKSRIVKYDLSKPELGFVELIPEAEDMLSFTSVVDHDKLVLVYMKDVKHVIKLYDLKTGKPLTPETLSLPVGSIIKSMSGKEKDSEMFFLSASYLSPGTIYRYDFKKNVQSVFREIVAKDYDSSKFQTEQVFYSSADGTKIPMYIISKKNSPRNGNNPTILYAYGGFNISVTPSFSVAWLTFIDKFDGVVAVANIRGGSEYGEEWYKAGRLEKKQNCFTDFQYAAKHLFSLGVTKPEKLCINGGSNGGLLVGACVNQAPDLFALGMADVGVMDCLRYHKFTIGSAWKSDFGDPDKPEDFDYIIKWSPLHNVNPNKVYPAVLLLTADHDDRVVPLHSLKLMATLQHTLPNNPNPLMIRVNTKAGHGAGKSTQQYIEEYADKITFLAAVLKAEWKD
ncbi:hypothetical protein HDV05_008451 [Chytridiales sp. JEL 0842]|nr:hypothetical protein HDV05_008451 [Chytridiales sp. JEL 0842]